MRMGLVSDKRSPLAPLRLYQVIQEMGRRGHEVLWIATTEMADAVRAQYNLTASGIEQVPATCRYVVPCTWYDLDGGRLVEVEPDLLQDATLQTRLFTYICLIQRELPCHIWHAWGGIEVAYLTVYTARFLGLPAAVSCPEAWPDETAPLAFVEKWVMQHLDVMLAGSERHKQRLQRHTGYTQTRIEVTPFTSPGALAEMIAGYETLRVR